MAPGPLLLAAAAAAVALARLATGQAVPDAIAVAGLRCHPEYEGVFARVPGLANGKARWTLASGSSTVHLYWTPRHSGYWLLDHDDDDGGYSAYVASTAATPTSGGWLETCHSAWAASPAIVLTARLSAANCAGAAAQALALPACVAAPAGGSCPLPCAQAVLLAADQCESQAGAFAAGLPAGTWGSCQTAMGEALAGAPANVAVSGLRCHPGYAGKYMLQPVLVAGKPHYMLGRDHHLYWSESEGWVLDSNLDDAGYKAHISSTAAAPPRGGTWRESCDGDWEDSPLVRVAARLSAANCGRVAAQVLALPACEAAAGGGRVCPLPCAELLLSTTSRCEDQAAAFAGALPAGTLEGCRAAVAAVLDGAAASVHVSGMQCHPEDAGEFLLQPVTVNGHAVWAKEGGDHIYWSSFNKGNWHFNDDTDDSASVAILKSTAARPPPIGTWQEACNDGWINSQVTLAEQLTAANCAAAARHVLALPVCGLDYAGARRCPLPCAEVLLLEEVRCAGQADAFARGLPGGWLSEACRAAVAVVLAGVPASIVVEGYSRIEEDTCRYASDGECDDGSAGGQQYCALGSDSADCADSCQYASDGECDDGTGSAGGHQYCVVGTDATDCDAGALRCHPGYEGEYVLQPVTVSGKPHWASRSGNHHIYWEEAFGPSGGPTYALDADTDTGNYNDAADLISPADGAPTGSAVWREFCGRTATDWGNTRLQLTATPPIGGCDAGLVALAPVLTSLCCGHDAKPECGVDGELPETCSPDCRGRWAPFAALCPAVAGAMAGTAAGEFFGGKCTLPGLEPVPPTELQMNSDYRDPRICPSNEGWVDSGGYSCRDYPGCLNVHQYADVNGMSAAEACCSCGSCSCGDDPNPARRRRALPFVATAGTRYLLQLRAAPGLELTGLLVLPPAAGRTGADLTADPLASQIQAAADKSIGWTAPASGTFYVVVDATEGAGAATVSVEAVGTALGRARPADTTGVAVPIEVVCHLLDCNYHYGGVSMLDGDGAGFELSMQASQGVGYSLSVELLGGTMAAEVHLTVYFPRSTAGVGGFTEALGGALGDWAATPPGHHSWATHWGCADEDRACYNAHTGARPSFGFHPGRSFESSLRSTWAAPAAGLVLLRVAASCSARFFADVEAEGCHFVEGRYGCTPLADGTLHSDCRAGLSLAVTAGAHFETSAESALLAADMFTPMAGLAVREATIEIGRIDIERLAAELFVPSPTMAVPPTLDQMLVPGTEASVLLDTLFTAEQQPHLAIPTAIEPIHDGDTQQQQDEMFRPTVGGVTVRIQATAPSVAVAANAIAQIESQQRGDEMFTRLAIPATIGSIRDVDGQQQQDEMFRAAECAVGMSGSCTVTSQITQVVQSATIAMSRAEVEQRAAEMFVPSSTLPTPPTLDQMLVPGTEAAELLASMFTAEQQPHLALPIAVQPLTSGGGHRRALQKAEGTADRVIITVRATAPTAEESEATVARLQALQSNGR